MGFMALQAALAGAHSLPPSVSLAPASFTIAGTTASQTTGGCTATVSNGQAPFTYSWSQLSGGTFTINNGSTATASFTAATSVGGWRDPDRRLPVHRDRRDRAHRDP
jgi:hypothetical protein